jgi:magnesium-transporting ATPase (P-type)
VGDTFYEGGVDLGLFFPPHSSPDRTLLYVPTAHHAQHTLYCGTRILQMRGAQVLLVVTRTGFATLKGQSCFCV